MHQFVTKIDRHRQRNMRADLHDVKKKGIHMCKRRYSWSGNHSRMMLVGNAHTKRSSLRSVRILIPCTKFPCWPLLLFLHTFPCLKTCYLPPQCLYWWSYCQHLPVCDNASFHKPWFSESPMVTTSDTETWRLPTVWGHCQDDVEEWRRGGMYWLWACCRIGANLHHESEGIGITHVQRIMGRVCEWGGGGNTDLTSAWPHPPSDP
jgi:hypothetical protein